MKKIMIGTAVMLTGCAVQPGYVYAPPSSYNPPPQTRYQQPAPPQSYANQEYQQPAAPQSYETQEYQDYQEPPPQPVVSVYVEPPLVQPAPVLVAWAPPPMLVEIPPPVPYYGAVWTGGYWVWEGNWVWAHGRWTAPPQPGYGWVNPYYENRGGAVVFINGFWAAPGYRFTPPPLGINITVGIVSAGVRAGPRCNGPQGVFVPAPPGSHYGLIVPAPIGTAPAVVTSAPPIINQGMRITTVNNVRNVSNVNNVTNVSNVTNISNNVTIVAPANATATGRAFNGAVPAQPHLAAAMTPVVHAYAPTPLSNQAIPAYVAGRQPLSLPGTQTVQTVHTDAPSALSPNRSLPAQQRVQQQPEQPGNQAIQRSPANLPPAMQDDRVRQIEQRRQQELLQEQQRQQPQQRPQPDQGLLRQQQDQQRQQQEQRQQQDQQQRQQQEQRLQQQQRQQQDQQQQQRFQQEQRQQQEQLKQKQQMEQQVQQRAVPANTETRPQNNESREAKDKRAKEEAAKRDREHER